MRAGKLAADLAGRVIKAQLAGARAVDLLGLDPRKVLVAGQRTRVVEGGRHVGAAMNGPEDDHLVGVAAEMVDQNLHAGARYRIQPVVRPSPWAKQPHPGAVALGPTGAGAVRMGVVVRVQAGDLYLDAPVFVAVGRLALPGDHPGGKRLDRREVDAGIEGRRERHAPTHTNKSVLVARLAIFAKRQCIDLPAAGREQCLRPFAQRFGEVVGGPVSEGNDDVLTLFRLAGIHLRMTGRGKPRAEGQIAHVAGAMHAFGLVLVGQNAGPGQQRVVLARVARVRWVDDPIREQLGQVVAGLALVDDRIDFLHVHLAGLVVAARPPHAARHQRARRCQQRDRIAVLDGRAVVIGHRPGWRLCAGR